MAEFKYYKIKIKKGAFQFFHYTKQLEFLDAYDVAFALKKELQELENIFNGTVSLSIDAISKQEFNKEMWEYH